ncbi:apolipoprotein [Pontoporia blainvillei]|uniref:Apolipoprotein n=1 Tax=Pontoporia blainvillei TaxID=48723 RepID=A0ABX0S1W7_PONBL|nr:apolipoprotein [Pontoporia blainvillei]
MRHMHYCLEAQVAENFEGLLSDCGDIVFALHFSDGRIKYTLNKNSVNIEIPLPFGGKSSKDLKMLETIRTPALNFQPVGFHLPSQEFQVPTFTIPRSYQLRVPLLGVLDLSTNTYSNLYNWSASYTGGNTSTDPLSLQAQCRVKADAVVDLLSYHMQGSAKTTYDHRNTLTFSGDGSLHHKFLDSHVKLSHVEKTGNNPASKGFLTFDASSAWGPQISASVHLDSKKKQHLYVKEVTIDGQFRASSFYAKGVYGLSYQRDPTTGQLSGESNLRFNSSYLQGTNQITGRYEDGTVSITSTLDLQGGLMKNTASLKYENYELTLNSDTNGKYEDFATSNKMDLTFSKQSALLRSEYQADYKSLKFFTLLSGSLNSHGLELNADILGTDRINSGAHKATLRIAQDGMSTSATTNLKYSPLMLENELNAALGLSGASLKLTTNGRFREHHAKFSLDGRATLAEVINQEGLKLSNDMMGSYAEMKLDYTNSLNIAGLSLDFSSKLDNIYTSDKFYKQNFNLQLQPYSLLIVGGTIKGAYQNNELKHIYTLSYADLSAMAPFTMTVDTHTNGNGKLVLWGQHTGQLRSIRTALDHKISALLTLAEQTGTWKLKTQLNQNEYSQDFSAYNTKDKVGVELSGRALADLTVLDSPITVPRLLKYFEKTREQVNDYLNAFNWEKQIALDNAKINLNGKLSQLQTYVIQFDQYIKDNYDLHDFKAAIAKIIDRIIEKLKTLDEHYHIRIQEKLQQLSAQIQNVDIQHLAEKVKQQVEAIDVRVLLDQVLVHEFIETYKIDHHIQVLMDKSVQLAHQYKLQETVQKLSSVLQQVKMADLVEELIGFTDQALKQLEALSFKQFTEEINRFLDMLVSVVHMKAKFQETLEDVRDRVYQMDMQQEVQRYLFLVGQVYSTLVTYISDWWNLAAKNLTDFAEQYSLQDWAKNLKTLVEQGFTVPKIQTTFGTIPAFEIDFKKLKDIKIPSRFSTPEFTVLNTFHIPSFTVDLVEIKTKIIRTIDQMLNKITIPEFVIPHLNVTDFQVSDLHIPEFQLPHISHTTEVPTFGKLYGILKIQSPLLILDANADIQNVTASANQAEIEASVTAKGESKLEVLNFDFQANAQLSDPKINPLVLKESVRFSSKYLKMEHESEVLFVGNAIEGKSNTVAGLHTEKNTLELSNGVLVKINHQLTLESNTKYFHKLNIPKLDFSSQADLRSEIKTLLEAGHLAWTSSGTGSWKLACHKFSDEGTHESQSNFTVEGPITSFGLSNKINSKHLRVNQNIVYESRFLDFSKFEIQSQAECQYLGRSVLTAKAQPHALTASTNNEGNLRQGSWQASARFNQYKYNQNFSAGNNEKSIEAHIGINGEANLDFLNIPLTIPEMTLPYTNLTTPQAQYKKNKDKHSTPVPLAVFYAFINRNINSFNRHFETVRNKALDFFIKSYNEAKITFDKYKVEKSLNQRPRIYKIPGYTIPVTNIEVSPFTAKMLTFGNLLELSLPEFKYKLEGTSSLTRKRGLKMNFKQELNGNTKSKPTVSSSIELKYDFSWPRVYTTATGAFDHKLSLECLTSYFSIESSTKGGVKAFILSKEYSGALASEASTYLNSKGTRSSVKLLGASKVDGIWNLELGGLSLTSGEHTSKATLELSLWEISALVQNNIQLSNDREEARLDTAGSLEGYLWFLKDVVLPVYDKSLWDLLKLDVTTNNDRKQYLHASAALVYTKNPNGYPFSIPVQELADKFIIPGLKLNNLTSVHVTPTFHIPFTDLQVPSYILDFSEIKIYKKLSTLPFSLNIPTLPKVKFPKVDVLAQYSKPEVSSVPFFEITVPASQLTVSHFTLPKSISVGSAVLDLNVVASSTADFELPTVTMPEQTIEIPSMKFSVPAGIFIPSFGTLTARFEVASPLYNATWSAGLKNKEDHVETFLDSTCSSTIQFLEYDLNVVGTHKIEGGMLVCKTNGSFAHHDFSAEYEEVGRYQGLGYWNGKVDLNITSPTLTDVRLRYQKSKNHHSSSVASAAIGTVVMDMRNINNSLRRWNLSYRPQSSPDKTLNIVKIEMRGPESDDEVQIIANWEEEAVSELLSSLKDNMPKAMGASYDYVNKYHQEYTGLDLRDASLKLRRGLQNSAEQVYQGAVRQIDEVDVGLRRVARGTTRTYQRWKDKAKSLYQELLAQEDHSGFQRLQKKVFDSLIGVTQEYNVTVNRVIDSFMDLLKSTRFQLPGGAGNYTEDELYTMVLKKVGKLLSQVHSKIHSGLEILFSYFQDLIEKSELIKDLKNKFPFDSVYNQLIGRVSECGKLLKSLSQEIQKALSDLQSVKTTEMLSDLKRFLQSIFQEIEEELKRLKEKKFTDLINDIQHDISTTFDIFISFVFRLLKENLGHNFGEFNELVQNKLQEASQELQQLRQYVQALRKEYFDPSMVGWTVKYYELEEKFINLIKNLVDVLKDFHSKYTVSAAGFASQLSSQVEQLVQKDFQEYLSILADADGKGKEKIAELSTSAQEIIKNWAVVVKEIISDYRQQFTYKLQDFADQLSDYYEKFIAESKRLIDLSIQNYHMFLRYIMELLKELPLATVNGVSPYIKVAPGEFTVTFYFL